MTEPLAHLPSPESVFGQYAADRRQRQLAGYRLEVLPHLVRHTPLHGGMGGTVMFADLPPGRERELILAEIEHFRALGMPFEWKVYDLDRPADLRRRLEGEGFEAGEEEAFLVIPAAPRPASPPPPGIRITRIEDPARLPDVVGVQEAVWDQDLSWLLDTLGETLSTRPDEITVYCAYAAGEPVATGWIDFPPGSRFADLHGGAVLPAHRGRGIFGVLLDLRLCDAANRGYEHVAVDAAPMSRPLLLARGFREICGTVPMRLEG
jgi:GNAT superfamily N-acetyltransferase